MNASQELLENLSFCVLDLETTGGNHVNDQIIEIGMVHVDKMKLGESKNFLINPGRDIPEFIQKLTNITTDTVKNAPKIQEVMDEILDFIGDRIIVAHNSGFDVPFLNSVLKRLKKSDLENKVICTNIMTRHLIPEIMSSNLSYMSSIFNIDHANAHRAIQDAIATAHLLIHYLRSFKKRNITKVNQLYYPRNRFEIDRLKLERSDNTVQKIGEIIKNAKSNLLFIIKGKQGIFKSIIPFDKSRHKESFIFEQLDKLDWEVVTIKQIGSLIDGYLFLNTHLYKLTEISRADVLQYLSKEITVAANEIVNEIDFFITPHLINGQYSIYNFLNLNVNSRLIFRLPGHEKKIIQQLRSLINRFTINQKKKRKIQIYPEILNIIALETNQLTANGSGSSISINDIKNGEVDFKKISEKLSKSNLRNSNFPLDHI